MRTFFILSFIIFFASCVNHKNDIQIGAIKKTFFVVKDFMKRENVFASDQIQLFNIAKPEKIKLYYDADININKIAKQFLEPADSAKFFGEFSSKEIKTKYNLTVSKMLGEFDNFGKFLRDWVKGKTQIPEFVELSSDPDIRSLNILSNQINILNLQLKFQQQLLAQITYDGNDNWDIRTIDNKANKIGDQYIAYLIYAIKDYPESKAYCELVKLTLNGKDCKTSYHFEKEDGVHTLTFTPKEPGLYKWEANEYRQSPSGELVCRLFKGQVLIKK